MYREPLDLNALLLQAETLSELYPQVLRAVLTHGAPASPRCMPTLELLGVQLRLARPVERVLAVEGRVINPAFAVAEAVWILSGTDAPWIFDYNRQLLSYADEGRLRGAYGPRLRRWGGIVDQLSLVLGLLREDPDTRRAAIQLFDPARDWAGARDVPCTIGYRVFARSGALHMHTTMRSQDCWLGLPYDFFANTLIHELLAGWLDLEVGHYVHSVDSLHLYDHDLAAARLVRPLCSRTRDGHAPRLDCAFEELAPTLEGVLAGNPPVDHEGWKALANVLLSHRCWRQGDLSVARELAERIPGELGGALRRWQAHVPDARRRAADVATKPADG